MRSLVALANAIALAAALALVPAPALGSHETTLEEYMLFKEGLRCHADGDYERALECWLPLALGGIAEAQYNVGRMYAYGEGVETDYAEAYAWFIVCARNGRQEGRDAMNALFAHMSPAQVSRAYARAGEIEKLITGK